MSKTETKSTVLLKHHLKALRLPTILDECDKVAGRCAAENADHLSFLLQLCELELIERLDHLVLTPICGVAPLDRVNHGSESSRGLKRVSEQLM